LRPKISCVTDQRFFTGVRPFTFFEKGVVGHVGFADPFDEQIAKVGRENVRDMCVKPDIKF
jgi:5'-methylthioadenosine phosphorylase